MKKFLPLILLLVGLLVVAAFVFVKLRGGKTEKPEDEEANLIEVSLNERPIASLTPTSDGHYLKFNIEKIVIPAASLDYELLYQTAEGVTQGVPGTVDLKDRKSFSADLLLGSESSGKFRYDDGVEKGTLSLRFRNDKGKLIAKFSTDFNLITEKSILTSPDGKLEIEFSDSPEKGFFVVMQTFGIPDSAPSEVTAGPYGFFASGKETYSGSVKIGNSKVFMHITGPRWEEIIGETSFDSDSKIFVGSSI